MLNILVSVIIVYSATSVWETFVHWKILHANRHSRLMWKRLGGFFNLLRKAYFSHNTIHHVKTYKSNYFIQFDTTNKKLILDSKLESHPNLRIQGDRYGLSISGLWENVVFMVVPLIFAIVTFLLLSPEFLWVGVFIAATPMLLSKYVHPLLHEKTPSSKDNSIIMRHIIKSKYFSYIKVYHFIHHQYGLCNFNLMPGGDYLLGVARIITPKPIAIDGKYQDNLSITNNRSCE